MALKRLPWREKQSVPANLEYGKYIASDEYAEYYNQYLESIRESDSILIGLIRDIVAPRLQSGKTLKLIDIGCASGALLYHLKHQIPQLSLTGADAYPEVLERCRQNPSLEGIQFEEMDALHLPVQQKYDLIVFNAVLFMFPTETFENIIQQCFTMLNDGGALFMFDFFNPYEQEITITEVSKVHSAGMVLHFRSAVNVKDILRKAGFTQVDLHPFEIPIDLEKPSDPSDITTHTVKTKDGHRLLFRGGLYQPWTHLVAQKP
jgi:2-polyprenyl-3-methyl-5-hydroxy-6-metoxy-1,4-benzoquinol methylase